MNRIFAKNPNVNMALKFTSCVNNGHTDDTLPKRSCAQRTTEDAWIFKLFTKPLVAFGLGLILLKRTSHQDQPRFFVSCRCLVVCRLRPCSCQRFNLEEPELLPDKPLVPHTPASAKLVAQMSMYKITFKNTYRTCGRIAVSKSVPLDFWWFLPWHM